MKARKGGNGLLISYGLLIAVIFLFPAVVFSATESEEKDDRPERGMAIALEYPGVVVKEGEKVSMDLTVFNKGKTDEVIDLELPSVPKGWDARIKTYSFTVTGVNVENGKDKRVTFEAKPGKAVGPGKYPFQVKAQTRDGRFRALQNLLVTVVRKESGKRAEDLTITTSYPVLRGPTDAKFEFSLEVSNKMDKEKIFNLSAQGPENWEINFKPAYEEKYISSLRIKGDQSQNVAVQVKPYFRAMAGKYPIKIRVSAGQTRAEAELTVILTGTYKLDAGTPTGLLSLETHRGKEANLSIYVKNSGSAPNHNIRFVSFKPENWKLKLEPEKIDVLEPGDLKQVEVTITPAEEALVGDYSVGLSANGEKASENIELRVTVKASTGWGWIGIGLIVVVIACMCSLFIRVGRR